MKFESSYNITARPHVIDEQLQHLYRDRVQVHSHAGSILAPILNRLIEQGIDFQLTREGRTWTVELAR